jgi:hypothetical protein
MWRNSEMTEKANLWWPGGNVPSPKEGGGGVWESSTSKAKTRPSSSSTWTSFIIKRTSHGLGWYGIHTTQMGRSLMLQRKRDPSGGKMCLNLLTILEELHRVRWEMAPQFSFGLISGMIIFFNKGYQDYTLLPRTRTFQWLPFYKITLWKDNSISPFQNKLSRNITNFSKLFTKLKFQRIVKTLGIISGETPLIQHPSFITFLTGMSTP